MLRHAHFYIKGGEPPFAAVCTKFSYAQIAYFAKSRERPKAAARASPREALSSNIATGSEEKQAHFMISIHAQTRTVARPAVH
jgi:hypothetical protein